VNIATLTDHTKFVSVLAEWSSKVAWPMGEISRDQ